MKIKLDENLPFRLVTPLKDLGHDTLHKIWISQTRAALPLVRITASCSYVFALRIAETCLRGSTNCFKKKTSPNGRDVLWWPRNARFAS